MFQGLAVEIDKGKSGQRREEGDFRTGIILAVVALGCLTDHFQRLDSDAALEAHRMLLALAVDDQVEPVAEGVDDRYADAVQPAGDLVGILVELAAGVQFGHDHFGGGNPFALVDIDGDAAAVIGHRAGAVRIEDHLDLGGVARQHFVDGVIDHFVDHVVQAGAVIGVADIHAGPLADGVETFQNLDRISAVFRLSVGIQAAVQFFWHVFGLVGHGKPFIYSINSMN